MKKIKDFAEKDRLELPLLIKEVKNGTTSKGAPYLTVTVQDNTGTIEGKFWDVKPADAERIQPGKIVMLAFDIINYNNNLQLRFSRSEDADLSQISMDEYVISSGQTEDSRRQMLSEFMNSFTNETYRTLVYGMLKKVGADYMTYPAASRIHHSYLGGLSEHSLSMASMAEDVCRHYPQLDRDLLIAGALVHDVGKTAEMSGPVATEYTLEGKLEGHISIANGWLTEVADELGLGDTEEAVLLHHMILSHHGHYEFGSPVLPMLQEAEVLSLIDNLDARLNTLNAALEATKPGAWTTKLFALENRQFYKPQK